MCVVPILYDFFRPNHKLLLTDMRSGNDFVSIRPWTSNIGPFACAAAAASTQVGLDDILLHHSLGIEKRAVEGNRVAHHFDPSRAIMIKAG